MSEASTRGGNTGGSSSGGGSGGRGGGRGGRNRRPRKFKHLLPHFFLRLLYLFADLQVVIK
jgi:hypothetical protein